jgi:hypothetical protein
MSVSRLSNCLRNLAAVLLVDPALGHFVDDDGADV